MKRSEFKKALTLAQDPKAVLPPYLGIEMNNALGGCALDKKRRFVTLAQVASMIVGNCATFAGTWDMKELAEIETLSKRFDLI